MMTFLRLLTLVPSPYTVIPSPGAVCPARVTLSPAMTKGEWIVMRPPTSNTTVRLPALTASRNDPAPLSFRLVT